MTFGDVWRSVRLQVPAAPALLIQRWVQDTFNTLADSRGWVWTTADLTLLAAAPETRTVGVVQGSVTVTGAAFAAADVGRQLQLSTDTFTILAVTVGVDATLDQAYPRTTDAAATATLLDAYYVCPLDFGRFIEIMDRVHQRPIPFWGTQHDLDQIDPSRSNQGTPEALIPRGLSPAPATLGRLQYEWWPRPSAAIAFSARYSVRPAQLSEFTELRGVLANRPDVLEFGALARAAAWPGVPDHPNPYFNLALARDLRDTFQQLRLQLDLRDDDQQQQSWSTDWTHRRSVIGMTADRLRATDATSDEYF